MDTGLIGKTAIVAGGSRGIGKAIALGLTREGVDVAIISRNLEALSRTASRIAAETNRKVIPLVCDVTDRAAVDAMVAAAVEALGGLNILVNSASLPGGSPSAVGNARRLKARVPSTGSSLSPHPALPNGARNPGSGVRV